MPLVPKIDPNKIFASNAPSQDKPAAFDNYEKGMDETRKNLGRPTIPQLNYLHQTADQKILWIHQNGGGLPYDASIEYAENAVTLKDGELKQLVDGAWVEVKPKALPATAITTASSQNQQQINDFGGAKWYAKVGGYELGATVKLDNGDTVQSTKAANIANPNVDMTAWKKSTADADALKQYATLALATADIANIPLNKNVFVSEAANGGYWYKATAGATGLTKSPYDPLTHARNYADANPLFKPVKIAGVDLNTILESGIYTVTELVSATLALNVPKNEIGFLLVARGTLSNIVYQNYYASSTIFTRRYNGTSWSVWSDNGYKETVKNSRDIRENRNIIETAFDMSSNIFSGAIPNTTTDPQGNIVADSARWLGNFISCAAGEVFSVSTSAYRISYYDENKVFISQISSTVITSFTVAPVNAKYFRLSGTTSLDAMQLNKGAALLPYEPFKLHPKFLPEQKTLPEQKILVEPKQTTFFNLSSNLFDTEKAEPNKTIDGTGSIVSDDARWLSDFIEVESGKTYSVPSQAYRIIEFTGDKKFISMNSRADISSFEITQPATKFIRLSSTIPLSTVHVNEGSELLPYMPFGHVKIKDEFLPEQKTLPEQNIMVEPEQTTFFHFSSNLFDTERAESNKTIDATGNVISDVVRWLSDFIEVESGKTYSVPSAAYRIIEFDGGKKFISMNSTTAISSFQITKPATKFIRLSSTTPLGAMQMNEGSDLLPYEPFGVTKIKDEFLPDRTAYFNFSLNLFEAEKAEPNKTVDGTGNVISDDVRWLSDFIEVEFGKTYSVPNYAYRIIEFDGGKKFTSRNSTAAISSFQITKPATKFIRLSSTTPLGAMQVNEGSDLLPYMPFGQVKIKDEFLPDQEVDVDVEALKQQLIAELTQTLLPKYSPSLPSLNFNESISVSDLPMWMSSDGTTIYGYGARGGKSLMQSTDDWETRVQIGPAFSHTIMGARTLDDGELLVSTTRSKSPDVYSKIWKSIGYDKNNPSATTFKEVLVATNIDTFFTNRWGMSTYQNIVTISEYGRWGLATGAKHVYLSTDYGDTFSLIFDLYVTDVPNRPVLTETAHMHTTAYDPYYNRIWVVVGDSPNTATYYSDDMGASWTYVTGSNSMQYTGIQALPDTVIFGSDRAPNGVFVYHRKDKYTMPKIEPLLKVNDLATITHVFGLPFKKDWSPTSPVYFYAPIIDKSMDYAPCIVATVDGKKAFKMWEGNNGDVLEVVVGPTASGKIIASIEVSTGTFNVMRALAPSWSKT